MESDVNVKADLELTRLQEKINEISKEDLAELKKQVNMMNSLLEKLTARQDIKTT